MVRGAWRATVDGVTESDMTVWPAHTHSVLQTRLTLLDFQLKGLILVQIPEL